MDADRTECLFLAVSINFTDPLLTPDRRVVSHCSTFYRLEFNGIKLSAMSQW